MAKKISLFANASLPLDGTEKLAGVQDNGNVRVATADIATLARLSAAPPTALDASARLIPDDVTALSTNGAVAAGDGGHALHSYVGATAAVYPEEFNTADGKRWRIAEPVLNHEMFGAAGNGVTFTDGAMTAGSATFTSAGSTFTPADVGKGISVEGALGAAVAASQTLTFTGQPANGETVTIDGKVFTFQTALTNTDGNVKIAASTAASVTNLLNAINATGGTAGTDYAAATMAHMLVTASAGAGTSLIVTARYLGTLCNDFAVSETVANASWGSGVLAGGVDAVHLHTTIAAYVSAHVVTLAAPATVTVAAAQGAFGTDDTAAVLATAAAANRLGARVEARPRAYYITAPPDTRQQYGACWSGGGHGFFTNPNYGPASQRQATIYLMGASNVPIFRVGSRAIVSNIALRYACPQGASATSAIGLEVNGLFGASLINFEVRDARTGVGIAQSAVGGILSATSNFVFASLLQNIVVSGSSHTDYDLRNYLGGGTNIIFNMLYAKSNKGAGTWTGRRPRKHAFRLGNFSGFSLSGVSIDQSDFLDTPIELSSAATGKFDTIRFEEGQILANNKGWVTAEGTGCLVRGAVPVELFGCRVNLGNGQSQFVVRLPGSVTGAGWVSPVKLGATWKTNGISAPQVNLGGSAVFQAAYIGDGYDPINSPIDVDLLLDFAAQTNWAVGGNAGSWIGGANFYTKTPLRTVNGEKVSEVLHGGGQTGTAQGGQVKYRLYIGQTERASRSMPSNGGSLTVATGQANWNAGDEIVVTNPARGGVSRWRCYSASVAGVTAAFFSPVERHDGKSAGTTLGGNASVTVDNNTLSWATMSLYQQQTTPLTANRSVTLSNHGGLAAGEIVRFERTAASTGAFAWTISDSSTGQSWSLLPGQHVDLLYTGTAVEHYASSDGVQIYNSAGFTVSKYYARRVGRMQSGSDQVATFAADIPQDATGILFADGVGQITFAAAAGATVNVRGGLTKSVRYGEVRWRCIGNADLASASIMVTGDLV